MKKSEHIFAKIQKKIHSEDFRLKHRLSEKAFIRNCVLTFTFLLTFILNQLKKSNAAAIDESRGFLKKIKSFTKSALSKARLKLSPKAFIELNDVLIEEFYENKSNVKRFFDFNVLAIDGSKFQLPESVELKIKYGSASNQNGSNMNMALVSQLVDAISGIVLHALLFPYNTSERDLAAEHIKAFVVKRNEMPDLINSIILFDRGYPSISLIAKLCYNNIHYLIRSGTGFLKEINDFVNSGENDGIVKISSKKLSKSDREELLKECPGFDLSKD
ncbi:MAG: transposase, partial [Parachlamydiaceae bacterium]|nr:transposase [Parachlamydiaceae bacterium]